MMSILELILGHLSQVWVTLVPWLCPRILINVSEYFMRLSQNLINMVRFLPSELTRGVGLQTPATQVVHVPFLVKPSCSFSYPCLSLALSHLISYISQQGLPDHVFTLPPPTPHLANDKKYQLTSSDISPVSGLSFCCHSSTWSVERHFHFK